MSKHKTPTDRWFKSGRIDFSSTEKVDVEKGVLFGVVLCQVGEAKGHGIHLEQSFIDDCVAYANKNHSKVGMKSRFGHPGMSNETLGTEMGRFKNFRVDGEQLKADLHLLDSANLSPNNPGIKDWMLSMAEEDPAMIMCSIVFKPKYEYQYDEDGKRVNIWFQDEQGRWHRCRNKNGEASKYNENKKLYTELDKLHFCDIVDQGAATDKLFSEQFNSDKFSVIATQFLNENPKVDAFIKDNPEKLLNFLNERSGEEKEKTSLRDKFLAFLGIKPKEQSNKTDHKEMNFDKSLGILNKDAPSVEELAEVKTEIETYTGANEKFTAEEVKGQVDTALAEKDKIVGEKDKELGEKDKEIAQLQTENKELKESSVPPKPAKKEGQEKLGEDAKKEEFYSESDRELDQILGVK